MLSGVAGYLLLVGLAGSFASALMDDFFAVLVWLPGIVLLALGLSAMCDLLLHRRLDWPWRVITLGGVFLLFFLMLLKGLPMSDIPWLYSYPGDVIRFEREYPKYSRYVSALPHDGKRFAEFNWGGMLFASRGITYDETDEVVLPRGTQSADWQARMKNTDLTCGGNGPIGVVEPIRGHYYLTTFGC